MIIDAAMLAKRTVALAEEKQAQDIVMLDLRGLTSVADYFVICTGESERQIRAILRDIEEGLTKEGVPNPRIEGVPETGWVILDYGDVMVHVFAPEQREYYRLERLWQKATPVLVVQ
ncbi:MAG: ribosomal silencing factor RsfS [Herpetosiphonaceae bacterium]|nr:MAG: ribosomal silencing factor RsfS [Herpetosiphonaceae bacterium]